VKSMWFGLTRTLVWSVLGIAFLFGMLGTVSVSHLIGDSTYRVMATITMVLIATLAGALLARREPIKSFLASEPVLWFLFVFNLVAGVVVLLLVHGAQGLVAAISLIVVALGAGASLRTGRRRRRDLVRDR
jgi:hypothetical protein